MALSEDIVVMMLKNEFVELDLKNGSIGIIKDVVYTDDVGPRGTAGFKTRLMLFTFRISRYRRKIKLFPYGHTPTPPSSRTTTDVIINIAPPFNYRCIPANAITLHKSQGQSVGPNEVWKILSLNSLHP
jgi:ATP-dependent exoDNAse (exonuclease V) alpha subunit